MRVIRLSQEEFDQYLIHVSINTILNDTNFNYQFSQSYFNELYQLRLNYEYFVHYLPITLNQTPKEDIVFNYQLVNDYSKMKIEEQYYYNYHYLILNIEQIIPSISFNYDYDNQTTLDDIDMLFTNFYQSYSEFIDLTVIMTELKINIIGNEHYWG